MKFNNFSTVNIFLYLNKKFDRKDELYNVPSNAAYSETLLSKFWKFQENPTS
jgi:hypothetical protein